MEMPKPANSTDKPSPSDTPSDRPNDNGGKAVIEKSDQQYHADNPPQENISKEYQNEEQPVDPIKDPPKEKGMDKGQVQPD